jgi:hypothetical protein
MAAAEAGRAESLASGSRSGTPFRPARSGGRIANNRPHPDDPYNLRQFTQNGNPSLRENAKLSRFYKVLTIIDNTTKIIGFRDC